VNSQAEAILNLQERVLLQILIAPIADRQQADSLRIPDQLLHKDQVKVQPPEVTVHQPGVTVHQREVLVQVPVLLPVDQQETAHTIEVHPEPAAQVHTVLRVQEVIILQEVVVRGAVLQVHEAVAVLQVHAAAVPQVDGNFNNVII